MHVAQLFHVRPVFVILSVSALFPQTASDFKLLHLSEDQETGR